MSMRNFSISDGTWQLGTHFPLMVKTHNICSRSKEAEERRAARARGKGRKDKKKFTTNQCFSQNCWHCKAPDHEYKQCPKLPANCKGSAVPQKCGNCGQRGHGYWECQKVRTYEIEQRRAEQQERDPAEPPGIDAGVKAFQSGYWQWGDATVGWVWRRPCSHEKNAQMYPYWRDKNGNEIQP